MLAGLRHVGCISDVLARWTLKTTRRTNLFDTSLIQYLLILCYDTACTSLITHLVTSSVANSDKWALYAPSDSRSLIYGVTHVEFFHFFRNFKMVSAPRLAATSRLSLEQAAMTWSYSATSGLFKYTTHLSKYKSGHTAQVRSIGFMHAMHEQVFGLASMVDFGQSDTTHTHSRKSETS